MSVYLNMQSQPQNQSYDNKTEIRQKEKETRRYEK